MSLLNSKFDITSYEHPIAPTALGQLLDVAPISPATSPISFNTNGTIIAGGIPPGALVMMDEQGRAILADSAVADGEKVLVFVTTDGNMDGSGALIQRLTVLAGGFTMETDIYEDGVYTPGMAVTFGTDDTAGYIIPATGGEGEQIIGFVGPKGVNTTDRVLQVIVPQGCGL